MFPPLLVPGFLILAAPAPMVIGSIADTYRYRYNFDTDPDIGYEKFRYGSGSRPNFDTDPDPGKNNTDPDPDKKGISTWKILKFDIKTLISHAFFVYITELSEGNYIYTAEPDPQHWLLAPFKFSCTEQKVIFLVAVDTKPTCI